MVYRPIDSDEEHLIKYCFERLPLDIGCTLHVACDQHPFAANNLCRAICGRVLTQKDILEVRYTNGEKYQTLTIVYKDDTVTDVETSLAQHIAACLGPRDRLWYEDMPNLQVKMGSIDSSNPFVFQYDDSESELTVHVREDIFRYLTWNVFYDSMVSFGLANDLQICGDSAQNSDNAENGYYRSRFLVYSVDPIGRPKQFKNTTVFLAKLDRWVKNAVMNKLFSERHHVGQ